MSETIANKGKTYDDLADILKTANNKLQNEQDKQYIHQQRQQQQLLSQKQKSGNINQQQLHAEQEQPIVSPVVATQTAVQATPKQTQTFKTPDNYKAQETIPHSQTKNSNNEIASQLEKKKKTQADDAIRIRTVTLVRKPSENDKIYFLLSTFILILTCLIILGSIFGLVFLIYKQLFVGQEYIQFDEEQGAPHIPQMKGLTIEDLRRIEETIKYKHKDGLSDSTAEKEAAQYMQNKELYGFQYAAEHAIDGRNENPLTYVDNKGKYGQYQH